jgi:hypothetical protein
MNHRRSAKGSEYAEIVLIGYSVGALIARKAYLFAMGQTQDRLRLLPGQTHKWASKVTRIILLAGMNRGWSIRPKPRDMSLHKYFAIVFALPLSRLLSIAGFARAVQRGAPFITNLRIQWLNLICTGSEPPLTVQLLGDTDDVVAEQDSIDVESGANFKYLQVPNTGHMNILDFSGRSGAIRSDVFKKALLTPPAAFEGELLTSHKPDWTVKQFVFVIHGIRDL